MKTKTQIINEVAQHYTSANRCIAGETCVYQNKEGGRCAVGGYIQDDCINLIHELSELHGGLSVSELHDKLKDTGHELDDVLVDDVRGYDIGFWGALQYFHDTSAHWDSNGLTTAGEIYHNALLMVYAD